MSSVRLKEGGKTELFKVVYSGTLMHLKPHSGWLGDIRVTWLIVDDLIDLGGLVMDKEFDISDVELVDCPVCHVSTYRGTERCPVCGTQLKSTKKEVKMEIGRVIETSPVGFLRALFYGSDVSSITYDDDTLGVCPGCGRAMIKVRTDTGESSAQRGLCCNEACAELLSLARLLSTNRSTLLRFAHSRPEWAAVLICKLIDWDSPTLLSLGREICGALADSLGGDGDDN